MPKSHRPSNTDQLSRGDPGTSTQTSRGLAIAQAVDLDMRSWWSPEQEFLSRLSKSTIAAILREVGCSENAAKAIERSPKTEAVAQAECELDGRGWLPSPLLTPGAGQADAADRERDDGDDEAPMPMAAE